MWNTSYEHIHIVTVIVILLHPWIIIHDNGQVSIVDYNTKSTNTNIITNNGSNTLISVMIGIPPSHTTLCPRWFTISLDTSINKHIYLVDHSWDI
jgi:hypothetical protein